MAKPLPPHHLTEALELNHCRAICEEIGERLQYSLARTLPVPTRLRELVNRIAELEGNAPPLIPDCGDEPPARERPTRGRRFWSFPIKRDGHRNS
jgi:hypothetical protein